MVMVATTRGTSLFIVRLAPLDGIDEIDECHHYIITRAVLPYTRLSPYLSNMPWPAARYVPHTVL